MKLSVSKELLIKYPALRIGYVVANNINNGGELSSELIVEGEELSHIIQSDFPEVNLLSDHPFIQLWRDIYRENGSKPNKYTPTVEALLRRIIKGAGLPIINKAVNTYLTAELKTYLPIGGYDLDKLDGDINLRYSHTEEIFYGINGSKEETYKGEIVYADKADVLTRRWNYRDCFKTQITATSKNIILFVEAPDWKIDTQSLKRAIEITAEKIKQYCAGQVGTGIADFKTSSIINIS